MAERAQLRVEIESLEQKLAFEEEERRQAKARTLEAINLARKRGRMYAHAGDYEAALHELENVLRLAAPTWPERERVERDVASIRAFLEETEL